MCSLLKAIGGHICLERRVREELMSSVTVLRRNPHHLVQMKVTEILSYRRLEQSPTPLEEPILPILSPGSWGVRGRAYLSALSGPQNPTLKCKSIQGGEECLEVESRALQLGCILKPLWGHVTSPINQACWGWDPGVSIFLSQEIRMCHQV